MDQTGRAAVQGRARGWLFVFLAAALILGVFGWHVRPPGSRLIPQSERKPLPDFEVTLFDGSRWSVAGHHGEVVLINSWATWCGPCQEEMPSLNRIAAGQDGSQVAVLGLSLDVGEDAEKRVRQFLSLHGVKYPVALEKGRLSSASDTIGIPNTLLIDRDGRLAEVYAGPIRASDVLADLRTLAREP